jgi:hypothetical protein
MSEKDEKALTDLEAELERARQQAQDLRKQLAADFEAQSRGHEEDRIDPAARRGDGQEE